jgi:tetratricopeptide (TPR) repeat protein
MPAFCHIRRSVLTPAAVIVVTSVFSVSSVVASTVVSLAADQENSVQKLLERGALQEAVDRASSESDNVESIYLAAQALVKMNNAAAAGERYNKLTETSDDAWHAIGESGGKLITGDTNGAMEAADRAVVANGENPYAHYQLGLVAMQQNNFQRATDAFTRATQLKPDLAYAHLYAGQSAQRLKQTAKMADHFRYFIKFAPDAPERQAVQAILRSLQ